MDPSMGKGWVVGWVSLSQKSEGLWAAAVSTSELWGAMGRWECVRRRRLAMVKDKQARAERESFPERFPPSSQPREGVEIKGGGKEWAFSLCSFQVGFLA